MIAHAYNPQLRIMLNQEDGKFKTSLGHKERKGGPCVMINFKYQLVTTKNHLERNLMRNYLDQIVYRGTALIALIEVGWETHPECGWHQFMD